MTQNESVIQICYAEYFVKSTKVKAGLHARPQGIGVRYYIELEQQDVREICDLGTDIRAARELFLRVVWGGVSACTLADVVQDYAGTLF